MFDWQTLAVLLIVAAACAYVARRAWARLRSMRAGGAHAGASSCATGCGKCGDEDAGGRAAATTPRPLVQIGRAKGARRRVS